VDYFFVKSEDVSHNSLMIRGEEAKHIAKALRKEVGDRVFVTDGNDIMYEAIISKINKTDVRCSVSAIHRRYNENSREITIAVSLLKNPARFDYLIEKTTELGVRMIIPLLCERTIPRRDRHERFEKIALAAVKQCGRSWLPRIQPLQSFSAFLENSHHWHMKFISHEKADLVQTISGELKYHDDANSVLVAIGPEGGFSDEEIDLALRSGFKSISLGPRRLRTETAAVIAMAELLKWG